MACYRAAIGGVAKSGGKRNWGNLDWIVEEKDRCWFVSCLFWMSHRAAALWAQDYIKDNQRHSAIPEISGSFHATIFCCERNRHVTNVVGFSLLSLFSQLESTINGFRLHFQVFRHCLLFAFNP